MTYAEAKDEFDKLNKIGSIVLQHCICTPHLIAVDFDCFYVKPKGFDHFIVGVPPFKKVDLGFELTPEKSQILGFEEKLRGSKQISNGEWATGSTSPLRGLFIMEVSNDIPSANIDLRDYIKFKPCDSSDFQSRDLENTGFSLRPTDKYAPKPDFEYPNWICTGMQRILYLHDTLLPKLRKEAQDAIERQILLATMTEEQRNAFLDEERKQEEGKKRIEETKKAEQECIIEENAKEVEQKRIVQQKKKKTEKEKPAKKAVKKAADTEAESETEKSNKNIRLFWLGLCILFLLWLIF